MDKDKIIEIYHQRAFSYDSDVKLFNLIRWRVNHYRIIAVEALNLKRGYS